MKILTHSLVNLSQNLLETEIRFYIASARASGDYLIVFYLSLDEGAFQKQKAFALKEFKTMKKEGRIDFFADDAAFKSGSAEASYLKNKFPGIEELVSENNFFLIVKL